METLIDQTNLIYDESFMMGIMDPWANELTPFREYIEHVFEKKKNVLVADTGATAVPLKEMCRELFHPMDKDNKDSTPLIENLTAIAARAWIDELLDPKKATFQYLSESGSDYCWSHFSDEVKTALMGKMAVNDRAESSFAGVTAQIQDYGRIGLANSAAIRDMGCN